MSNKLNVVTIQYDTAWEKADKNYQTLDNYLSEISEPVDVVVFPEMFNTGFTMNAENNYETISGKGINFLKKWSKKLDALLIASLIIKVNENYYNRLAVCYPDQSVKYYDKKHLFTFANEHKHYSPGNQNLTINYKDWKIACFICFDLRFPVWCRNDKNNPYDIAVFVANWPTKRVIAWKNLLQARAIENQSYVIGVNRVGIDGNEIEYNGASKIFNALGEEIANIPENQTVISSTTLDKEKLNQIRESFPFLQESDTFELK